MGRIMGGENVAVVMEKTCANGAKVVVRDDCYRDATPEEIERRHQAIWRAMCMIARHNAESAPAAREAVGA